MSPELSVRVLSWSRGCLLLGFLLLCIHMGSMDPLFGVANWLFVFPARWADVIGSLFAIRVLPVSLLFLLFALLFRRPVETVPYGLAMVAIQVVVFPMSQYLGGEERYQTSLRTNVEYAIAVGVTAFSIYLAIGLLPVFIISTVNKLRKN